MTTADLATKEWESSVGVNELSLTERGDQGEVEQCARASGTRMESASREKNKVVYMIEVKESNGTRN